MARASSPVAKEQVERLELANLKLAAENERLRTQLDRHTKTGRRRSWWRGLLITLSVILATGVLVVANILFWAGNTLINTDKYVATVQPLLANKNIQVAIADYTTAQVFHQVDVQTLVTEALPPRADFLAPQLTSQLRGATESALSKTLASNRFQTLWVSANRKAQEKLISAIKNSQTTDGVISLQDIYNRLSQSLKGTKLSFLADKTLPKKAGSITVVNAPWIPKARFVVNNIGWLKPVALLIVAVFSALAIWLARHRRRMVIILGTVFALSMVTTLIVINVAQDKVAHHAQPTYQTAVGDAAHIILQPLSHQTLAILAFSLLIAVIAWLTGPYSWARCTVAAARQYLTAPTHRLIFKSENQFTEWLAANRQSIEWVAVALVALIMLLVQLSLGLVVIYGILMLVLVLVTEILAAPHSGVKR